MKRGSLLKMALLLGFFMGSLAWGGPNKTHRGPSPKSAQSEPDYFPLHVGNTWKYHWTFQNRADDYTVKVLKTETEPNGALLYDVETATSTLSYQEWYSKSKGVVEVHKTLYPKNNISGDYAPIKLFMRNPLRVEETWSWKGTGIMGVKIEESSKVMAGESVEVPAGKFTALKVETDLVQNGAKVKRMNWFANGAGLVKSVTQSNGMESTSVLLEYHVAATLRKKKK